MSQTSPVLRPNLLQYHSYRNALSDFISFKIRENRRFSYRNLCRMTGVKSPGFFQSVIRGEKNLTPHLAESVGKVLGLSAEECSYFKGLVKWELCDPAEKQSALVALEYARGRLMTKTLTDPEHELFSKWYYSIIFEQFSLHKSIPSPEFLKERFLGPITLEEVKDAIEVFLKLGYVVSTEEGWTLNPTPPLTSTSDRSRVNLLEFHMETWRSWLRLVPSLQPESIVTQTLTAALPAARLIDLQKRLDALSMEIMGWAGEDAKADQVVQIGFYVLPAATK